MEKGPRSGYGAQPGEYPGVYGVSEVFADVSDACHLGDLLKEGARKAPERVVGEESARSAYSVYLNAEGDVEEVIHHHARNFSGEDEGFKAAIAGQLAKKRKLEQATAIKLLRECQELRLELLERFVEKLKEMQEDEQLPDEFDLDALVTPNHTSEPFSVASRDYAALLALSMLDGTFDIAAARKDPIVKASTRVVVSGAHRYVAMMLIGVVSSASESVVGEVKWQD